MNNKSYIMFKNVFTLGKLATWFVALVVIVGAFNFGDFSNVSRTALITNVASATSLPPPPALPPIVIRTCNVEANLYEVPTGGDLVISWTTQGFSNYKLNGQDVSGPNGSKVFKDIKADTTYTLVATDTTGNYNCTTSVTVRCLPIPAPTCTLTPQTKTINSGESVNLTWTSTNAESVTLTDFGSVALNGSENTGPLTANKSYLLTVLGKNGKQTTCQADIIVKKETPKYCKLELIKSVGPESKFPVDGLTIAGVPNGSELIYTIKIKNIGTANCTGGGVKIVDVLDPALTFISSTESSNITAGYNGQPLYNPSTRTLMWDGDTLTPGEEGTITWRATVKPTLTCGTTKTIPNTAKATAYELNNFLDWVFSNTVETVVKADDCPPPPVPDPTCTLSPADKVVEVGSSVDLTWTTANAKSATLTDFGSVDLNGTKNTGALTNSKTYVLSVLGKNGKSVSCQSIIAVKSKPPLPPTCDTFTATPISITKGASSTLTWATSNASRVVIDNGIGAVSVDGQMSVSPLSTIEYTLKAYGPAGEDDGVVYTPEVSCKVKITVTETPTTPLPKCVSFTASPNTLPNGGGKTTLTWTTSNAKTASIAPTIGNVAVNGSTTVTIATSTNFTLTIVGSNDKTASCAVPVTVTPPTPLPFTCANNVTLSASPTSINRGENSVITWSTTGVDSLSFNTGISATGLSGSATVSPTDTTSYILTAKKGNETIACPVSVSVTTGGGGGGGGSASPTCNLSVSDNTIRSGETVTLRWGSRSASQLEIVDSNNNVIVTTKGKSSSEKRDYYDGSIKVSPKFSTTYTLTVERGSRDRVCKVRVDVEGIGGITQIRDQQPLIAGIALNQVPYTGFAAGPVLTMFFYLLLLAWAVYLAYVLVIKRDVIGGYRLAGNHLVAEELTPEQIRPDVFVSSVHSPSEAKPLHKAVVAPANLPVSTAVIGYDQSPVAKRSEPVASNSHITDETVTALENHAHAKRALLSSDAIRHLIGTTDSFDASIATLNEVISQAKSSYPSEDGWVVINEKRMRELCLTCQVKPEPSSVAPFVPTIIPEGSGSLAESIVTGNIVAAYEMIGNRPMFALADAASDMDSILRARRGSKEVISEMLVNATANLSEEQIVKIIAALTGALDGTYNDEASAVKMAIMKAVKVVA